MKHSYSLLLLLLLGNIASHATVVTCSNNVLTAGQYTDLQTAVNAANLDDTVFVAPSAGSYGNVTISKRITLLGGGWYVTGTQNNWISEVGTITLDSVMFTNTLSGTHIQGLKFYGVYKGHNQVDNVVIERCWGYSGYLYIFGSNWVIKQNYINYCNIIINNNQNAIISNNFIDYQIANSNSPNVVIANNIFTYYYYNSAFSSVSYALVTNNIFYYYGNPTTGCSQCVFDSNISYVIGSITFPGINNTGGNNFSNQDPQFVGSNYASGTNSQTTTNITQNNWNLKATSPGHRAGTDGTDIGIYGGMFPPVQNFASVPAFPQVQILKINNTVVPQGGMLNTTIKARIQN